MGLLDDAIREHLELKRRRGGDPGEISQQEQEALGPVRRTREGAEDEQPEAGAAVAAPEEEAPAAPDEPVPADPDPASPALADFGEDFADEPAGGDKDRSRPVADIDQPTEEWGFDDDEEEAEPEPEPDEDPLEDTPDFLQETPEHDRLWFEQKPPKDFDFDE